MQVQNPNSGKAAPQPVQSNRTASNKIGTAGNNGSSHFIRCDFMLCDDRKVVAQIAMATTTKRKCPAIARK